MIRKSWGGYQAKTLTSFIASLLFVTMCLEMWLRKLGLLLLSFLLDLTGGRSAHWAEGASSHSFKSVQSCLDDAGGENDLDLQVLNQFQYSRAKTLG